MPRTSPSWRRGGAVALRSRRRAGGAGRRGSDLKGQCPPSGGGGGGCGGRGTGTGSGEDGSGSDGRTKEGSSEPRRPAGGTASPVRPGPAWGARGRGGAGTGRGRPGPGRARRDPPGRGAGRGLQGRGLVGGGAAQVGGRSGGLGAGVPPTLARPAGSPAPRCTGGGRISRTLAPRGVRWRGAATTPATPGGVQEGALLPTLPKCSEVAVPPVPRGQCPPGGHPQVLPWGLGRDSPHHNGQSTDGPPGSPQAPEGSACSQAWSPGPAPVAWARPPTISLGRAPHSCPSLSSVTLKVFIGGEDSPHPHSLPRVLISGPGAPSFPFALRLKRSWEGGMKEPRLGMHEG